MKTVMIVIGAARSGSTLLSKAIGGHSQCFAIGEINRFNDEINDKKTFCGCANLLSGCHFWNNIIFSLKNELNSEIKGKNSLFKVGLYKQFVKRKKIHYLISTVLFGTKYKNKEVSNEIENTLKLYRTIFNQANCNVIIDSSKNLFRALVLASCSEDIDFKFAHIVRDGRGVLNSKLKSSYSILNKDGIAEKHQKINTKNPLKIINSWLYVNLRNYIILKLLNRKKSFFIHYEDFTSNPEKYLKQIYKHLNLNYEKRALNLGENENHILGGNASRINAKKIKRQDEAWRKNLNEDLIRKFNTRAGWFNKLIGYNN